MEVIDRINELVRLRESDENELKDLAREGKSKKKIISIRKHIGEKTKEIEKLYAPFGPTESNLRSFMGDLRQLLNAIPMQPLELGNLRSEIERLGLPSNIQKKWPPLGMRASYGDLLIIKGRLGEMLAYLPAGDNSEGQASPLHEPLAVTAPQKKPRERGPNVEKIRERLDLEAKLTSEFGTIKERASKYAELRQLKRDFPDFALWVMLSEKEQEQLLKEPFKPRAYALTLVMRKYGLTNRDTIRKSREKLPKAR